MTQKQLVLVEIIPIIPMNMKRAGWQSDNGKNAAESLFPIDLRISILLLLFYAEDNGYLTAG